MRLLSSHSWQFFLYTARLAFSSLNGWELAFLLYTTGLAFSSLKEWELAFLLYTSGTASSLYTGPIAPLI